jgi:serine phosphatase RsbU (regulator of sigma subunit)
LKQERILRLKAGECQTDESGRYILVLYTDGVYDGTDEQARALLEAVMREHYRQSAREICNALLDQAVRQDNLLREKGDNALIDDKTVFIVKRT